MSKPPCIGSIFDFRICPWFFLMLLGTMIFHLLRNNIDEKSTELEKKPDRKKWYKTQSQAQVRHCIVSWQSDDNSFFHRLNWKRWSGNNFKLDLPLCNQKYALVCMWYTMHVDIYVDKGNFFVRCLREMYKYLTFNILQNRYFSLMVLNKFVLIDFLCVVRIDK